MIQWPKQSEPDPPGVTVPAWLVSAAKFASWVAMACLVMFLWLYVLDIARDRAGELHVTHAGTWIGSLSFFFPYVIPFGLVAFGIPYVAKIALPTFMALHWHDNFWAKLWSLLIAVSVSLVVIAGTFTVQGHTLMERDRDAAVAVEQVQQGRAVLEARIESKRQELADMMNNSNAYLAQAASVGAAEWERTYIAQARASNDYRLPMLERALGAARAADTLRGEIETLRGELAAAPAVASVQREVVTERTGWIAGLLGWLEGARAILLSLVMDIVALIMPWIALRLEQARNVQLALATGVAGSGWADEAHRIPDFRAEDAIEPQPMKPAREAVYDAETGEELIPVKATWRKKPRRKGVKEKVEIGPEALPDEAGVAVDGGGRAGLVQDEVKQGDGSEEGGAGDTRQDHEPKDDDPEGGIIVVQDEPSDEEAALWLAAIEAPVDEPNADEASRDGGEPDEQSEHIALPANEGVMIAQDDDASKVAAE